MVLTGAPADYDEWGEGWSFDDLRPYLERARTMLLTAPSNTDSPPLFQTAFVEAARAVGLAPLSDPDDPSTPVGIASFPANVVEGRRLSTALAYLEAARGRPNLTVEPDTLMIASNSPTGERLG